MPGGGVEPPRPEGRRILSPLRLPVPPSRHCWKVLVTDRSHTFSSTRADVILRLRNPLQNPRVPYEILPPLALTARHVVARSCSDGRLLRAEASSIADLPVVACAPVTVARAVFRLSLRSSQLAVSTRFGAHSSVHPRSPEADGFACVPPFPSRRDSFFWAAAPVRSCRTAQPSAVAGMKKISRTSIAVRHALAPLRAHASASSMSAHSSIHKPPTCSLVSR